MISRRLKKIGRFILWTFFFVNILFVIIFFYGAQQVGYLSAKYDLWKGRYKIKTYGYPGYLPTGAKTLKRYGIDCVPVAGCVVNDFIIKEVAAYNLVMKKAIKGDLGVDVDKLLDYEDDEPNMPETILETPEPEKGEHTLYEIGHCFQTLMTNLDSDEMDERICLKTLKYQ